VILIASLKIREMLPLLKICNTDGINISKKKEININFSVELIRIKIKKNKISL
jgi:hypothetical protein